MEPNNPPITTTGQYVSMLLSAHIDYVLSNSTVGHCFLLDRRKSHKRPESEDTLALLRLRTLASVNAVYSLLLAFGLDVGVELECPPFDSTTKDLYRLS